MPSEINPYPVNKQSILNFLSLPKVYAMLKKIFIAFLLGNSCLVIAQGGTPFLNDANGRPVLTNSNNYVADGSPFLFEDYLPAEVTFKTGKVYKDVKAKINLVDNELLFMDDKGQEMIAAASVTSVKFLKPGGSQDVLLESPGNSINATRAPVYQVLVNGKASLLKQISITYTEARKYGEGSMTRTYKKNETFYAVFPGQQPQKFEKTKAAIAALFGDKQAMILAFIDEQKLRAKTEADFIKIFEYYSTLVN